MNVDSYKIFISISHRRIAFEYWQRDGEDKLVSMPLGNWPVPLAFYCSDSGIVIGEDAARAARSGTENAFDNYFGKLSEDITYTVAGQTRPIRNLILDASETVFRTFFKDILLNRYGSLNDNRANMSLTIICESDIKPNERAFLNGLFKDCGYNRVSVVDYEQFIAQYVRETISKEYICDKVVVGWTEGDDFTFTLFEVSGDRPPKQANYPGLGVDPRKKIVKKSILKQLHDRNPWIKDEKIDDTIDKAAEDFLSSNLPIVTGKILTSNKSYTYTLERLDVDYAPIGDSVSIKEKLDDFLRENGIDNRSRIVLLLRGVAADNSYFENNLSYGFSKTIKSDRKLREGVMKLLISYIPTISDSLQVPKQSIPPVEERPAANQGDIAPDIIKAKKRRWREVRAEAKGKITTGNIDIALQILKDFRAECESISGVNDILSNVDTEIKALNTIASSVQSSPQSTIPMPNTPIINAQVLKTLERDWRMVRASAMGKVRLGRVSEAVASLSVFAKEAKEVGAAEILSQIEDTISQISTEKPKVVGNKPQNAKPSIASKPAGRDEGEILILEGNLSKARDWYRDNGNTTKVRILNDIIRNQRGIATRKSGLEECRKSKNRDQIRRIIKEIEDFISLCDKVGVKTAEYKALLSEYKKI